MEKIMGKVVEVFIPEEYNNGILLDVMDRNNIGFRIDVDGKVLEYIYEQNELNSKIMKGDIVLLVKQNISGREFVDIELYDGVDYE